ncbi:aldo keto reductase [Staphylococcus aureus]|nr:aldo keto reductase [Staphylococcus aureus]
MNGEILSNPVIKNIAQEINKSPAQVIIRWNIDHDVITIPKSITPSRIEENLNVYDFKLTHDQIEQIDALNQDKRIGPDPAEFNG